MQVVFGLSKGNANGKELDTGRQKMDDLPLSIQVPRSQKGAVKKVKKR
jgi:hypothetical protein